MSVRVVLRFGAHNKTYTRSPFTAAAAGTVRSHAGVLYDTVGGGASLPHIFSKWFQGLKSEKVTDDNSLNLLTVRMGYKTVARMMPKTSLVSWAEHVPVGINVAAQYVMQCL